MEATLSLCAACRLRNVEARCSSIRAEIYRTHLMQKSIHFIHYIRFCSNFSNLIAIFANRKINMIMGKIQISGKGKGLFVLTFKNLIA